MRIRNFAVSALICIMGLCYVGGGLVIHDSNFADASLLYPSLYNDFVDVSITGVTRQSLAIQTVDGQTLDAWLFVVPGATKLVIVNHGNAGNLSSRGFYAQAFTQANSNVLLYDYRGYGKSTGKATIHGISDDGLTVYSYARNELHYPADKIIEFGESIGSAVACSVAAKEQCGALMLFAPLDSLPSAARWKMPILTIYPDFCFAERLNNLELIKNIHTPVFICHGMKDDTLRFEGSQKLYDAASQPKKLVCLPDSGHYQLSKSDGELYLKSLIQFVRALP